MMQQRKREEYDSLWKEKKEKAVAEDPAEIADNAEVFASGPAIVEVADTVASVSEGISE